MVFKTKTTTPPHLNAIYEIIVMTAVCTATYNGQTYRPLVKRIKEHEDISRLDLDNPTDFSHIQSAPATHGPLDTIWNRTTRYKTQWATRLY